MIYLGLNRSEKDQYVSDYCAKHRIEKVVILSPAKFQFACSFENHEIVEYADIIEYRFFYRLVQEVNNQTLIVINECLRTQNRSDLTYNCIRHFLNQTPHQLIFQYLPLIDEPEDFMTLFDFDTRSRWKREKMQNAPLTEARIQARRVGVSFCGISVDVSPRLKLEYEAQKAKLISGLGLKDPHTIPRNLYLLGGKAKLAAIDDGWCVGRNNRFKLERMQAYKEDAYSNAPYTIFEFCHNFIDFSDVISLSGQHSFNVLVADLKVDQWYLARYKEWSDRINACYSAIQRNEERRASGAGAD
jgi:hypothetical protein